MKNIAKVQQIYGTRKRASKKDQKGPYIFHKKAVPLQPEIEKFTKNSWITPPA